MNLLSKQSIWIAAWILLASACGSEESSQTKLIGGVAAFNGDLPGVVKIGGCTGAKVGQYTFLTAAHCLYDGKNFKPDYKTGGKVSIVGDVNHSDSKKVLSLSFSKAYPHKTYADLMSNWGASNTYGSISYDIAFVQVKEKTPDISILGLDYSYVWPDTPVVVTGSGCEYQLNGNQSFSRRLKFSEVMTVGTSQLNAAGTRSYDQNNAVFKYNVITEGKDLNGNAASICPGDSGGPLLKWSQARQGYNVIGVNSYYSFKDASRVSYTNWHTRFNQISVWMKDVIAKE